MTKEITCDIRITQYEDEIVKCEKKLRVSTRYDKKTVTCDKSRVRYDVDTV